MIVESGKFKLGIRRWLVYAQRMAWGITQVNFVKYVQSGASVQCSFTLLSCGVFVQRLMLWQVYAQRRVTQLCPHLLAFALQCLTGSLTLGLPIPGDEVGGRARHVQLCFTTLVTASAKLYLRKRNGASCPACAARRLHSRSVAYFYKLHVSAASTSL